MLPKPNFRVPLLYEVAYTQATRRSRAFLMPTVKTIPTPLITTQSGTAQFLVEPPHFEPGHNYDNDICNLSAENDWDAILEFINEYKHSEKTFRSYSSDLERFCLWLIMVKGTPLSGIKRQDLSEYYEFVQFPPISWCGKSAKKFTTDGLVNPRWRPFKTNPEGKAGLSAGSVSRIQKILKSLFTYLVTEGFLLGNPATSRRTKGQRAGRVKTSTSRFLQPHECMFVEHALQKYVSCALRDGDKKSHEYFKALRRHYVFDLFLHTGLRISEPVNYTMGDIAIQGIGDEKTYSLNITGKGNVDGETRTVVLGAPFISILKKYRLALNDAVVNSKWLAIDPLPSFEEKVPLISDVTGFTPISDRQISNVFVEIRGVVAIEIDILIDGGGLDTDQVNELMRTKSVISKFSCHWMRHTHATYFLSLTNDLKATQERLGHSDLSTTQIYLHLLNGTESESANKYDPKALLQS